MTRSTLISASIDCCNTQVLVGVQGGTDLTAYVTHALTCKVTRWDLLTCKHLRTYLFQSCSCVLNPSPHTDV